MTRARTGLLAALVVGTAFACAPTREGDDGASFLIPGAPLASLVGVGNDIDPLPMIGAAAGQQRSAGMAFNGSVFLAGWLDWRVNRRIMAARFGSDGTAMDPFGITVAPQLEGFGDRVGVATDGSQFLLVWLQIVNGEGRIYGARVTAGGTVLDPGGFLIAAGTGAPTNPGVAFGGGVFLVVWLEDSTQVHAARVSPAGAVVDATPLDVSAPTGIRVEPAVAAVGGTFLVTWNNFGPAEIAGRRVDSDGDILDGADLVFSSSGGTANGRSGVAGNGVDGFLVAWTDNRCACGADVFGTRVAAADGQVLEPAGLPMSGATGSEDGVAVTFDGTQYWVHWNDHRGSPTVSEVYAARVSELGVVQNAGGSLVASGGASQPVPAGGGGFARVLWSTSAGATEDLFGSRLDPTGSVLDPGGLPLVVSANDQWSPATCFAGTFYWVVWLDLRVPGRNEVFGIRVGLDGAPLDAAPIAIGIGTGTRSDPNIACGSSAAVVTWSWLPTSSGPWQVQVAWLGPNGTVIGGPVVPVSSGALSQLAPDVATDGTDFLVLWGEGGNLDLRGTRLNAAGGILDPGGLTVASAASLQYNPSLTWDGSVYQAVWGDLRNGTTDIYRGRITAGGAMLDGSGTLWISEAGTHPRLARGGGVLVLTWLIDNGSNNPSILAGQMELADGSLPDLPLAGLTPGIFNMQPLLTFDGQDFWLAWTTPGSAGTTDVVGVRINPANQRRDASATTLVSGISTSGAFFKMSSGGGGRSLLTYDAWDASQSFQSFRIQARALSNLLQGDACTQHAECGSGFCADGVCCESACGGSDPGDCQACSVAAGAAQDGVCGVAPAGSVCRAATASCDAAETCDGAALTCPVDVNTCDLEDLLHRYSVGCGCSAVGGEGGALWLLLALLARRRPRH